jgi:hypothetical protein
MNAAEERAQLIQERATRWRRAKLIDKAQETAVDQQFAHPWRANSLVLQAVFFVLTAIGVAATYGLFSVFSMPRPGIVTGIAAIVAAEMLVARRWFRTGVEAALLLAGLIALITELPSRGTPESMLVIAAAFVIPAVRLRQPFFGAVAAVLIMMWSESRFDVGLVVGLIMAAVAAIALVRPRLRASTDLFLILITLVMPIAGRVAADEKWRVMTIVLLFVYAAVVLFLGIRHREHALFFSSLLAATIATYDASRLMRLVPEAKFAIAGALLLAIAFAVNRALRDRTNGFVLRDETFTPHDDSLEIAATLAMQPGVARPPAVEPAPAPGGGGFGGAGASGDY